MTIGCNRSDEEPRQDFRGEPSPPDSAENTRELVRVVTHQLMDHTRNHPVQSLAAAMGVGYVMAAGLPSFALRIFRALAIRSLGETLLADVATGKLGRDLTNNFINVPQTEARKHSPD